MATKFFTKLDAYDTADNNWAKLILCQNLLLKYTSSSYLLTADLGLYNGSTKINKVETTLNIGNNPTTGGVLTELQELVQLYSYQNC